MFRCCQCALGLTLVLILEHSTVGVALDNGVASLPVLGWNTWCSFGPCGTDVCTEQQVMDSIEAMQTNGLANVGFNYITLDDCFAMRRNTTTKELYPDPDLFPVGFTRVVERAHAAGFKIGIYTSAGDYTCHAKKSNCSGTCNVGSLGYYQQDAATFARWELDFIKMDWCSASVAHLSCQTQYGEMAAALNATGRPIVFYMSCGGMGRNQPWSKDVANIWRIGNDHLDCWTDGPCPRAVGYTSNGHGTLQAIGYLKGTSAFAGPGGWNTADFLKTGGESCNVSAVPGDLCPKQTETEYRTEFSMWSMASAPLLISTDIRKLTDIQQRVLLNEEVVAINQQKIAGDFFTYASDIAPLPADNVNNHLIDTMDQWFVAQSIDALPERPTNSSPFFEYGLTANATECQVACVAHGSACSIFEWSAKSGNCWFRFDSKWEPRVELLRQSGCIKNQVSGCGIVPPPSPPSPPKSGAAQIWTKKLSETSFKGTKGWGTLANHYAVAVVNVGDVSLNVEVNISAVAGTSSPLVLRDVWSNATDPEPHSGMYQLLNMQPHETRLFRIWS